MIGRKVKRLREMETGLADVFCDAIYPHLFKCKKCQSLIASLLAAKGGRSKSRAKRRASRMNGRLGGRPRKQ